MKKIPTIFKRNPENMKAILYEQNDDCSWVFAGEGAATRKYDGACCLIREGVLYKRREVKKGKSVPENFQLEDLDLVTGKKVGWVPVDFKAKQDKWFAEAFDNELSDGTYELLGPKVQGNLEGFEVHTLIKHSEAEVYESVPRGYSELEAWLKGKDIEGLVFHHEDGRMAKIKKRDYGQSR